MKTESSAHEGGPAEWQDELETQLVEARKTLATVSEGAIEFIRERPVVCLVGALAAGYLFGRLVRR